jgi:glycosyltransferase involved in cell wall biosynthesis
MVIGKNVPAVSVVIATYNMGRYLGDAIDSVLKQTMDDLDVHVIDDGSTDNTREVVSRFSHDRRVHYCWQKNAGQARAKNQGIQLSQGALVAFCDADDMWLADKLERQCPLFENADDVGVVYSRTLRLIECDSRVEEEVVEPYCSGSVTAEIFRYNFIPFGTAIVRRRCLQELGAFDERYRMGIDWELWLRLSTRYKFRFLDSTTYVYRVWDGQMSANWRGRYDYAFRIMDEFLRKYPDAISSEVAREAWAHSFVQRARVRSYVSGEHALGIVDIGRALRCMPGYLHAWKSLVRICLNATLYRKGSP